MNLAAPRWTLPCALSGTHGDGQWTSVRSQRDDDHCKRELSHSDPGNKKLEGQPHGIPYPGDVGINSLLSAKSLACRGCKHPLGTQAAGVSKAWRGKWAFFMGKWGLRGHQYQCGWKRVLFGSPNVQDFSHRPERANWWASSGLPNPERFKIWTHCT